jgi:hypothetical protein
MFLTPYVARDRNGDAWVAWRTRPPGIVHWTHTYVSATTSTPVVSGVGRDRTVSWTLSEPAPESWWAVLRARGSGAFEPVARVRAGPGLEVSWTDVSPPAGVLRYRIRRESVDARYRWESEEAWWPPQSTRPLVLSRLGEGRLELSGAVAGPLDVRLYDLQGRRVLRREARSQGSGRDTIALDVAGLKPGIYFASVRDASGRVANPVKLVLLQ